MIKSVFKTFYGDLIAINLVPDEAGKIDFEFYYEDDNYWYRGLPDTIDSACMNDICEVVGRMQQFLKSECMSKNACWHAT